MRVWNPQSGTQEVRPSISGAALLWDRFSTGAKHALLQSAMPPQEQLGRMYQLTGLLFRFASVLLAVNRCKCSTDGSSYQYWTSMIHTLALVFQSNDHSMSTCNTTVLEGLAPIGGAAVNLRDCACYQPLGGFVNQ